MSSTKFTRSFICNFNGFRGSCTLTQLSGYFIRRNKSCFMNTILFNNPKQKSSHKGSVLQNLSHRFNTISLRNITTMGSLSDEPFNLPKPLVICGPSGVGKSTIIKQLTNEFPHLFGFSVSYTTREPRNGEIVEVNYHFITRDDFLVAKERGDFIETAEFSGNMYGTSKTAVQTIQEKGQICILDLEMQGVEQIKKIQELDPHYVFISPPNIDELERRLRDRKTETEDSMKKRLTAAKKDLEYVANSKSFDIVIVNDDIDKATQMLKSFIIEDIEKLKKSKDISGSSEI